MEITTRLMQAADIPDGLRLRGAAGWNQTEKDWRRLLALEPGGCFVACEGTTVCGSVTALCYEKRFGWIGMLLIDPEKRRQGIGTILLLRAISYLEDHGVQTVRLDGTPMGYGLYRKHGFVDEHEIQRWEGIALPGKGEDLPLLQASELDRVCAWDRPIFGADRSRLIVSLWSENPDCSAIVHSGDEIEGYVLWRPGARAFYLGPCIAATKETAENLLTAMMSRVARQRVFVDICTRNPWGVELLRNFGFSYQRPLVRMYRGPHSFPGRPEYVCAIAGPEIG